MSSTLYLTAWLGTIPTASIADSPANEATGSKDQYNAVVPTETINLIDPKTFSQYTVHLDERRSLTTNRDEIWKIDPAGNLQVIGKGMGYVRTNQAYRDYHLVLEYKWGKETYGRRVNSARDCGVLLHCYGPDGAFNNTYLSSIEAQLIEGGTGDFLVLAAQDRDGEFAPTSMSANVANDRDGEQVWSVQGETAIFPSPGQKSARINCVYRDIDWNDVKGFRGKDDVEVALGQWNRLEVICRGDTIEIFLNDRVVNKGFDCHPSAGYIALQSELADCVIRKFEVGPIEP